MYLLIPEQIKSRTKVIQLFLFYFLINVYFPKTLYPKLTDKKRLKVKGIMGCPVIIMKPILFTVSGWLIQESNMFFFKKYHRVICLAFNTAFFSHLKQVVFKEKA